MPRCIRHRRYERLINLWWFYLAIINMKIDCRYRPSWARRERVMDIIVIYLTSGTPFFNRRRHDQSSAVFAFDDYWLDIRREFRCSSMRIFMMLPRSLSIHVGYPAHHFHANEKVPQASNQADVSHRHLFVLLEIDKYSNLLYLRGKEEYQGSITNPMMKRFDAAIYQLTMLYYLG